MTRVTKTHANARILDKSISPDPYGGNGSGTPERLYAAAQTTEGCGSSSFAKIAIVHRDDSAKNWNEEPAYNCSFSFCRRNFGRTSFSLGTLYDESNDFEPLVAYPHTAPPIQVKNTSYLCPFRTQEEALHNVSSGITYWVNNNDISVVGASLEQLSWTTLLTTLGGNNYVASALYRRNDGNISMTMEAVATSMTNQIRQGPNATQVQGTALVPEVYIHVSWLWLILPTALVLLAIAFLTVTVGSSSGRNQVVWKSSSLATLFHSMHALRSKEANLTSERSMRHAADEMFALLRDDEAGHVALVYSDKDPARRRTFWAR